MHVNICIVKLVSEIYSLKVCPLPMVFSIFKRRFIMVHFYKFINELYILFNQLLTIFINNHLIHSYHQTANSKDEIIKHLAKILDNLNYFHPFREGNGRTQREVIRSLALLKGCSAQIRVEQDDEVYNLYMDGTVYGDLGKLEELFGKILKEI